jgi:hypothetical protein
MYKFLFLTLSLFTLGSMKAQADDVGDLARKALALNGRALSQLNTMIQELPNCSRYHATIIRRALGPARDTLILAGIKLKPMQSCSSSSKAQEVYGDIASLYSQLIQSRSKLMKAFEADPRYPACTPRDPQDKNSTVGSLAFQGLQKTMAAYVDTAKRLAGEADSCRQSATNYNHGQRPSEPSRETATAAY